MSVPHDSPPGGEDAPRSVAGGGISSKLRQILGKRRAHERAKDQDLILAQLRALDREYVDAQKPILEMFGADGEITDAQVDEYVAERRRAGNPDPDPPPADLPESAISPIAQYTEDPLYALRRAGVQPGVDFQAYPPVHRDVVPSMLGELCDTMLERSNRVAVATNLLRGELTTVLDPRDWFVQENVNAEGVTVPFLLIGPTGIVLLWVFDGDWDTERSTMLRQGQIARRAVERRLPDGRPASVWFWSLRGEPRKTTSRLGPSDQDLFTIVSGTATALGEFLRHKQTNWPLSPGIADVLRAATRIDVDRGLLAERLPEDGSVEP